MANQSIESNMRMSHLKKNDKISHFEPCVTFFLLKETQTEF